MQGLITCVVALIGAGSVGCGVFRRALFALPTFALVVRHILCEPDELDASVGAAEPSRDALRTVIAGLLGEDIDAPVSLALLVGGGEAT